MSNDNDNRAVQQSLARLVIEGITGQPSDTANATVGPLVTNHFSFMFFVEAHTTEDTQKVFVKIPKEDLRKRPKSILPTSPADRRMANDEVRSLRSLADHWQSEDLGVTWVRLRAFIPQYNAVVTDAVEGDEAFAVFRRLDQHRRLGSKKDPSRLREVMARLGTALARFHQRSAQSRIFRVDETLPKLERYCRELGSSVRGPRPGHAIQVLNSIADVEINAVEVPTLKGIDIRNVLLDKQDKLFLLDPGRMKRTCREADLARFIMTYRILYWGSRLFLLGLQPDQRAEQSFLQAYYSDAAPPSPKLLSFFLIKEQIKHWHTAIDSLHLLPWPMPLKRLVAATYINPFYDRQLAREMKQVR
jgi:hypothetical protein